MNETIRDVNGHIKARITEMTNYTSISDPQGHQLGMYYKSNNTTTDMRGNKIGTSNQLMRLIK